MANIEFIRSEVSDASKLWEPVRQVVAGQHAVKAAGDVHLPRPNKLDVSPDNQARFDAYLMRAVFVNYTGRTRAGLIGTAFGDWPEVKMPRALEVLKVDADGTGVGLIALAQQTLGDLLDTGRSGLWTDYPTAEGAGSIADRLAGLIRPNVVRYQPEAIINWGYTRRGGQLLLSLVVLLEEVEEREGFELKLVRQYRELALEEGVYVVRTWRKANKTGPWAVADQVVPLQGNGAPWDVIPFSFIGAINNDARIDPAPLYDLAMVNLAHYRNSADFEEATYLVGQPQYWMSGLSATFAAEMEKNGVYTGSRAILPVPEGEQAGLLQATETTMARTGMQDKQDEMGSLGARILVRGEAVKTAEQTRTERQAAQSVLSLCCDNLSEAYTQALVWASNFENVGGECSFAIDTEFGGIDADSQQLTAVVAGWMQGAIPTSDKNSYMRRSGLIDQGKTDDEIREEIEADEAARLPAGDLPDDPPPAPGDPTADDLDA